MLKVIEQKPTKMIKERQEESMDVYDQIVAIEAMDLEDLDDATIEAIAAMYEGFLALSYDAQIKEQTVNDLLNAWREYRAMIGLILVHLISGAYFAFKKRDVLVKTANN